VTAATTVDELLDRLGITRADVGDLLDDLRHAVSARVEEVTARRDGGDEIFPVVCFDDIAAAAADPAVITAIRRTGCVVVRATFEREQAEAWNAELGAYLERNAFNHRLLAKDPGSSTASRIWPVYGSRPQVLARQHVRMVTVRRFLNHLWTFDSHGERWFDPDTDIGYPDRIRRREPGAVAKGLASHADSPSVGGWRLAENQKVFAPLLTGGLDAHDAFDAAYRTGRKVESPVGCTVFRTFQGWTALSDMHPHDGVLHVVPIPWAVGYRLVHGLAGELGLVGDESIAAPRRDAGDELLERAMVPIPAVEPGDTVWWHGDLFHAVGPAANDSRWGNVMYIGAAPRCPRNDAYAPSLHPRFRAGASPVDFPADDFEVDFVGRATEHDLDEVGRAQFGLV
jgi:hypothetical protein